MIVQDKPIIICSDKLRIQQILLNLISNALKFSFSGNQVAITCKYIHSVQDLTFEREEQFINIV